MRIHTSTAGNDGESRENRHWKFRMKTGPKLAKIPVTCDGFTGRRSVEGGRGEWPGSNKTKAGPCRDQRWENEE
ncbi:unnamed protein product [Prunus armeniaca]